MSGMTDERQFSFTGLNRRPANGCETFSPRPHLAGDRDMQSKSIMQLSGARSDIRQVRSASSESSPNHCTVPFLGRCLGVALVILTMLVLLPGHSVAVDFYGSDPLGSTGLTVAPGVDLLNSDQFHLATVFGNPGTGDFGTVPYFMILTPEDWLIDISDLSGLTLGTEEFGTFTSTIGNVVSRSPEFVNVELNGLFERASFDDTAATLHFAMTKTGQSVSWSGTLAVGMDSGTGNVVPEPNSGIVAAMGLLSLFVLTRRQRNPYAA